MFIASDSGYDNIAQNLFLPNNGIFSDEFAKEHPYLTMAGNLAGDALAMGAGTSLWRMPKYRAAMQAENRAAQEAVANSWDDMINNGKRITIDGYKKPAAESSISWEDGLKVQPFQSELDWSPKGWFGKRTDGKWDAEDVAALNSHIPEYLEIERVAKANGTWLKMPDGSTWQGDPRSWVQLMSKDGQKLTGERLFTGMDMSKARNPEYMGTVWADKERKVSSFWAGEDSSYPGAVLEISPTKGPRFVVDAKGHYWRDIPREQNGVVLPITKGWEGTTTDGVVDYAISKGYGTTQINNVIEGSGDLVTDVVIHPNTPRKSLLGNNGAFDLSNPNIYKGLIPTALMGTVYPVIDK